MTNKTSDPKTLYSWAIKAVCAEMETRGFSIDRAEAEDETTVVFAKNNAQYGIALPKQSTDCLIASSPFKFFHIGGEKLYDEANGLGNISLLDITADEEEVKDWIARRITQLFGKRP